MRLGFDIEESELDEIAPIPEAAGPVDTPERQLFIALLESAVHEAMMQVNPNATKEKQNLQARIRQVARDWINGESEGVLVTFATVCELLGYEETAIRAALHKQWGVCE